jgi:hypothetical protein
MGYLTPGDYKKTIQADNLNQVIGSDSFILEDAEQTAIEDVKSGLVQKYEVEQEFIDTPAWDKTDTYLALDRVYLDAPTFSAVTVYAAGAYVTYQPNVSIPAKTVYKSIAGSAAHAFLASEWTEVGPQYTIYAPKLPAPLFNYRSVYKVGNTVFWKDKVYTCAIETSTTADYLQYLNYQNIPPANIFPDDLVNGVQYWGAGVAYSVAPGTDILNTTKWLPGDTRCKQIVWCVVALTLYYVHARIAPRNVPELRQDDQRRADKMIKQFAEGDKTPKLPVKQPRQGARVRYGGNIKNNNTY